jgi:hypothetical protein
MKFRFALAVSTCSTRRALSLCIAVCRFTSFLRSLRHVFPDAWYAFYQNAATRFQLTRFQMPPNRRNFAIKGVYFRVDTVAGVDNQGVEVHVTGPDGVDAVVPTNEAGVISTDDAALAGLLNANPLAEWQVEVVGGAPVMDNESVVPGRVYNVQMGLEYTFDYLPEAI